MRLFNELFGEEHPRLAAAYLNLGPVLIEVGDYEKALNYLKKAEQIRSEQLGPSSCQYGTYLWKLKGFVQRKRSI